MTTVTRYYLSNSKKVSLNNEVVLEV